MLYQLNIATVAFQAGGRVSSNDIQTDIITKHVYKWVYRFKLLGSNIDLVFCKHKLTECNASCCGGFAVTVLEFYN